MIEIDQLSVTYDQAATPILDNINVSINESELVVVAGPTGSGKSTLLGTLNGLVPHFTGGTVTGDVRVNGMSIRERKPRDFAELVGWVGQDPLASFVTDIVEDELAYGMEQLGIDAQVMRRRVEETLDLLGIEPLRRRPLRTLSGGQQQRVAIGSVLTMHPKVLVLDEPTSALDPTAAEEVLATLTRLVSDLGTTVILAEHRLERVVPFADRMLLLTGDATMIDGTPHDVVSKSDIALPLVQLGRLAGWGGPALTVREARQQASNLRERLGTVDTSARNPSIDDAATGDVALQAHRIVVRYGDVIAVRDIDVTFHAGVVTALMGRNGSGKSSLLWAIQGSGPCTSGHIDVHGHNPQEMNAAERRKLIGMVPQTPGDLLYLDSVAAECAAADRESGVSLGTCQRHLDKLVNTIDPRLHPRDLSEGQRLALVLAIQLTAAPEIIVLDEPTRGLDYHAKHAFVTMIHDLASDGRSVVVATHDVELVAHLADRVVVMAHGEIVSDGPCVSVLAESPAFAPQVCKVLGEPWMTVDNVRDALATPAT